MKSAHINNFELHLRLYINGKRKNRSNIMGIFDFLKLKKSNVSTEIDGLSDNEFDAELNKLQGENKAWEKDFNHIISLRGKASQLEKTQDYYKAIDIYLEAIEFGEKSVKLNFSNYGHDIERVIVLYGKTKQIEKLFEFLNRIIKNYPNVQDADKWRIRLSKLTNNSSKENKELSSCNIITPLPKEKTIGKELNEFKKSLPEFNFYHNMPRDMQTFEYLSIYKPVPFEKSVKLRAFKGKPSVKYV